MTRPDHPRPRRASIDSAPAPDSANTRNTKQYSTASSPPLTPGKMEVYSVRAKWTVAGREVEQFRVVGVRAGDSAQVLFAAGAR